MVLRLESEPGEMIEGDSHFAQDLANRIGVDVEFDFNGVKCVAVRGGDANLLAEEYVAAVRSEWNHKLAFSTHRIRRPK